MRSCVFAFVDGFGTQATRNCSFHLCVVGQAYCGVAFDTRVLRTRAVKVSSVFAEGSVHERGARAPGAPEILLRGLQDQNSS